MNAADIFCSSGPFMPHGGCYLWTQSLIALHAISDALIVLSYYSIPVTLIYFVRRRKDLKFHWMFVCFAVFILACGTSHLMEIWNIWHADYWLSGALKAVTALASVPTAFLLVKLIPQALALPSPDALEKAYGELEQRVQKRTAELVQTTNSLKAEIVERERTAVALRESEELFSKAFRLIPDCVVITRLSDRTVIRANEALCRLWGRTPDEVIGKPGRDYATWVSEAERQAFMQTLQEKGEHLDYESQFRLADGRLVDFNISSRNIVFNGEACILSVIRDVTVRKQIEVAAARLAAIVASSDDAIVGKDLNSIVTSWNHGAEKVFGYSAAEMVGTSITRLIPADRQEEEEHILGKIRNGENVEHFETRRQTKDGRQIEVSVTVSPIKNLAGEIIGASKVARDITERRRAAAAVLESQALYHSLVDQMPAGVFRKDAEGRYVFINSWFCLLKGITPEVMLGKTPRELARDELSRRQPEDVANAMETRLAIQGEDQHQIIMRTGRTVEVEEEYPRPDGTKRHLHVIKIPVFDAAGKIIGSQGVLFDVSQQKQMELALRESEDRFRTMANSMSQLAWIAHADGYIYWYNVRWYEYTGTTPEQMEGWGWQSVHDPEALPKVMASWKGAIEAGKLFEMEFPLRGADGTFRTFLTRAQPLKDSAGRVVQWFGTNTDVEAMKQAEAKIHQLNSELEQRVVERTAQLEAANNELEAFSYSVSHDLRAPLRAINGFAGIVAEDFGSLLPTDGQNYLERIRNGAKRMGELIDDLLAFSRLSRQPITRQEVDMNGLVKIAYDELQPQRAGRKIELKASNLPPAHGDAALLKQVWVNLLSNAVKYSRGSQPAVIEIGCTESGPEKIYFVRDNGTGFDMQYAHKLFGVFQRLHRPDEFEGTGVGLAIVQRIVQRHGGRVWAEAKENHGATFYFTLEGEK